MKRIKSTQHLQLEQERLAHRRLLLEEDIRRDWKGLLHHFEPSGLARGAFFSGLSWMSKRILKDRP